MLRCPLVTRYYGISEILLKHPIRHVLYNLCIRTPANLTIITKDGTNGLKHLKARNSGVKVIRYWPNGVDIPQLDEAKIRAVCHTHNISTSDCVLMTVGRLYPWKRVDRVIRTFAQLIKETNNNLKLLIVGHGPDEGSLRNLIYKLGVGRSVVFAGAVFNKDIYNYYAIADIVVCMYEMGSFPNSAWETLNSGKCFVILDSEEVDEVFRHNENAIVVKVAENENELVRNTVAAIKPLVENNDFRAKIQENALKYARQYLWTWDERLQAELNSIQAVVKDWAK
jgi:glycosyltransferase involved in cell wall biosynthesis